nr:MAG TPA: transposase [Bacteriophage sp.]
MLKPSQVASLMGVDIRTVQRRAKSGSLTCEIQSNAKNRPEYIFPLSTLPKHVQERYYARHSLTLSTPEKTALQKVKPSPVQRPLDSYTDAERKEIGFWRDVVDQWMLYRSQPGKPLSELDAKFVRHMRVENPGQELSVATLYRKKKALEEGDLTSVIDRRGKARKGKTDMPEYIKKTFLYYYLVDGGEGHAYSITKCMEYTEKWAEKNAANALPLPSYSSFYRLAMDVPEAVRILMREGDRAYYNKASVYTRRDYESIASNDWWVGDTYTCDTLTLGPDGKTHRPYLTAWVDVRSGIFVGWYISFGGNSSQNSIYALRRGCLAHGMPNYNAYVDNGREYLTFDFGGRGHRAKKVLANGEAPFEPKTILDYMGVEMKNAIVQNSRAKLVERSFRNVKEHIMRLFPTYTGGSPEEKPEALKKALQRGAIPTDAEFVQKVDLLISGYLNYEPYYGSVPADKGKRRIDVYNEHLEHVRHVEPDVLNLMMLRTSKPKKVDREGVYLNIRGKKVWYNCPELHSLWQEKKVYLRYDPDDLSSVRVYREDGSFILTAPRCDLEAAYGATQEEIARQQQLKNKYKRVVQELAATLLPDAPPEEAAALVARMAEENLAGPTAKRDPRTVELVQLDEEPWAMAVGEVNVFRMNQNSGGIDDEYDY